MMRIDAASELLSDLCHDPSCFVGASRGTETRRDRFKERSRSHFRKIRLPKVCLRKIYERSNPRKILFCVLYLLTPKSQSYDGIVKNKFLCIVRLWHVPELIRSVKWQEIKFLHFETDSGHINGAHHGISVCSLVVLVYKHRSSLVLKDALLYASDEAISTPWNVWSHLLHRFTLRTKH